MTLHSIIFLFSYDDIKKTTLDAEIKRWLGILVIVPCIALLLLNLAMIFKEQITAIFKAIKIIKKLLNRFENKDQNKNKKVLRNAKIIMKKQIANKSLLEISDL